MASNTVAVRLPDEVLEELQKRAAAQNKKVSDVVRDLIVSGLQSRPTENESNPKVIEYLEGFGGVLMGILFETAGSRYFAEMATSYGLDMESLLREELPMDKEAKAALMSRFEEAAMKAGQNAWARVLRLEQQTEDQA
jgi:plasmid stability protein